MEKKDFRCKNCAYFEAKADNTVGQCIFQPIERATFEYRACGQGKFKHPTRAMWMSFGDWIYEDTLRP